MSEAQLFIKKALNLVSDNSTTILSGVAVAGVITTAIFSAKGGIRAKQFLDEERSMRTEPLTNEEVFRTVWACYIPAATIAAATIACVVAARMGDNKKYLAIASAYGIAEKAINDHQDRIEALGSKKADEARGQIGQAQVDREPPKENGILSTGQGDTLFRDSLTGRYFYSDVETVRAAANTVNSKVINETYASLNEFFREVDLEEVNIGDDLGWRSDRLLELNLTAAITPNERPCLVIHYTPYPGRDYYKES